MQEIGRCLNWIDRGETALDGLEERIFHGDLDGAADSIRAAWQSLLEPLSILSHCWGGYFWNEWTQREKLEANINRAQEMLMAATPFDLEKVLLDLKDLMLVNFYHLRTAVAIICADVGTSVYVPDHDSMH